MQCHFSLHLKYIQLCCTLSGDLITVSIAVIGLSDQLLIVDPVFRAVRVLGLMYEEHITVLNQLDLEMREICRSIKVT